MRRACGPEMGTLCWRRESILSARKITPLLLASITQIALMSANAFSSVGIRAAREAVTPKVGAEHNHFVPHGELFRPPRAHNQGVSALEPKVSIRARRGGPDIGWRVSVADVVEPVVTIHE
jgi:hypothetical protein